MVVGGGDSDVSYKHRQSQKHDWQKSMGSETQVRVLDIPRELKMRDIRCELGFWDET
jgi:hypothetical protein